MNCKHKDLTEKDLGEVEKVVCNDCGEVISQTCRLGCCFECEEAFDRGELPMHKCGYFPELVHLPLW